jgi:DNA-binding CsgD family transcriptional regulator
MPGRIDILISALVLVLGQFDVWVMGEAGGSWPASIALTCMALCLLWRRFYPIAVALGVLLCQVGCAVFVTPDALVYGAASILAWYAVGRWANPRRGLIAAATVTALTALTVDRHGSTLDWINLYLSITLTSFVVPWLVGFVVRTQVDVRDRRATRAAVPAVASVTAGADAVGSLSPRELDVYRLLVRGATNSEIASELFLSVYTVKAHVASILSKLGLRDRVQVVVHAYENNAVR